MKSQLHPNSAQNAPFWSNSSKNAPGEAPGPPQREGGTPSSSPPPHGPLGRALETRPDPDPGYAPDYVQHKPQALPLVGQVPILGELEQRNTVVDICVPAQYSNTTLPRKLLLTSSLVGLHDYSTTSHTVHCHGENITDARWAIFEGQSAYSLRILIHANFSRSVFTYLDHVTQWIKIHTCTLSPVSLHATRKY